MNSIIVLFIVLSLYYNVKSSVRNQRDFLLFYHSKKYSIPKRQIIISSVDDASSKFTSDFDKVNDNNNNNTTAYNNENNKNGFIFRDYDNDDNNKQSTLSEGSFCRRSFDGLSGYCIVSHQCLHIVREFRKHGTKIDICSYQKNVPVICCPLEEKHIENHYQDRISAKKCAEYNISKIKSHRRKSNNKAKKCEKSVPLIVGGEKTYPGEYPHMAAIGWTKSNGNVNWACGGTLISEQYVLTAAHCTKFGGKPPDRVRLGYENLFNANDNTELLDIKIMNIKIHPQYKTSIYYHDIALLKLENHVNFTKFIYPACLWDSNLTNDIKIITATGWGRMKFLGPKSEDLLKVDLEIIDNEICNKLYPKETKLPNGITDHQFCAGYLEGGKDTCQGDSGGPISLRMPKYNCINYIVGITSFGKYCAAPNAPGVYIKISAYLDWIENIVFNYK